MPLSFDSNVMDCSVQYDCNHFIQGASQTASHKKNPHLAQMNTTVIIKSPPPLFNVEGDAHLTCTISTH
jgi:hypothetical protein